MFNQPIIIEGKTNMGQLNTDIAGHRVPTPEQDALIDQARQKFGRRVSWRKVGPNGVGAIVVELLSGGRTVAATRVLPGGMTSVAGAFVPGQPNIPTINDYARQRAATHA